MPHQRKISVIGLGYVGLSTAVAFNHTQKVIAFDHNPTRIAELKKGHDSNNEVPDKELKSTKLYFTSNPKDLKKADFHIVTVPTPVNDTKHPDLSILFAVSEMLGKQLKKGDIVVYESTVYPGATEEKCIPILERTSKLTCGKDFSVGYSPERINPADKEHTFSTITKIVSATDEKTLGIVANVYKSAVKAGVHPVSTIRTAEVTKIIENTQRDVNISLMNEIAIMLHALGINTREVIEAMKTKWNYIPFQPGLVGGHCIGVNSYYLMHKAEEAGCHSDVIMAGRRVNENIAKFIADQTIKKLIHLGIPIKRARIAVLGLTYKENCSDLRDTGVTDIIKELKSYDTQVLVHDPIAESDDAKKEYGINLTPWKDLTDIDAVIIAVAHKQYVDLGKNKIKAMLKRHGLIMDIKGILDPKEFSDTGITIWTL